MKNRATLVAIATTISLTVLSSCSKDDMGDKNIDYPAAYVVNVDISLKLTTLFYCKLTTPNRLPFSRSFSG
jgi:hypothetical protein